MKTTEQKKQEARDAAIYSRARFADQAKIFKFAASQKEKPKVKPVPTEKILK